MRLRPLRTGAGVGLALALALAGAAGCGKKAGEDAKSGGGTGKTPAASGATVAKVGGKSIHAGDVDAMLGRMPQHRQRDYDGARGKLRLIEQMVDRELMLKAAGDAGLERDPDIAKQLQDFKENMMLQAYQRKLVEALPKPTPAQLQAYYDSHQAEFMTPARINASWIKCATAAEAAKARRRIVERGEDFGAVARIVSTDKTTAPDGGLLGYFNPTGYIRAIPPDKRQEFVDKVFVLEAGDVSDVFPFDGGFAFVKVNEKTTERQEPFEKVQDRIQARLAPVFSDSLMQSELDRLRGKYKPQILFDANKELDDKSADDLMRMATEATDPRDKIEYYRALVKKYPTYERADEAQFMIGFVYSEELRDFELAKQEYDLLLKNYPNSDVKESALYMLQNMGHGGSLPSDESHQAPAPGHP